MRDNWAIGFTARYTVGVWVGNFSGAPMHDVSGVSGAAPVWREIMDFLHEGTCRGPAHRVHPGLVRRHVSFEANLEPEREEWFLARHRDERMIPADRGGRQGAYRPRRRTARSTRSIPTYRGRGSASHSRRAGRSTEHSSCSTTDAGCRRTRRSCGCRNRARGKSRWSMPRGRKSIACGSRCRGCGRIHQKTAAGQRR